MAIVKELDRNSNMGSHDRKIRGKQSQNTLFSQNSIKQVKLIIEELETL